MRARHSGQQAERAGGDGDPDLFAVDGRRNNELGEVVQLAGIEQELELPPEASNNIYEMSEDERLTAGIRSLPADLHEAIELANGSKILREALGDHVVEFLIRNKREEWDAYKSYVTPYEIERYLPIL